LEVLAADPDPTVEYEQGPGYEPATLSINTVRGKAMHAVVQYALWRRRQMREEGEPGGFDVMPEVRTLLNAHLDLAREPSPGVRSVYAQYFPALVYLDARWAEAIAPILFPSGQEQIDYWRAAWSVYATFARPFDRVFDILRPVYELSVQRMPWNQQEESSLRADQFDWRYAEESVACHLTAFYWRGKLELTDGGLFAQFIDRATPGSRSKAWWFIATSMGSHEGDLPVEVQERLKALWEWRMNAVANSIDPEDLKELSSFGGWFAYGKLDVQWLAQALVTLLGNKKLVDHVDHPGMVIERMAAIAATDILLALQCLKAFVVADRDGWRHTQAKEHVEAILQAALGCGVPDAIDAAHQVIDTLAEHGDLTYRGLLSGSDLAPV
jgi:hypothetical protein